MSRALLRPFVRLLVRAGWCVVQVALFAIEESLLGLGYLARKLADGGYGTADLCLDAAVRARMIRLG